VRKFNKNIMAPKDSTDAVTITAGSEDKKKDDAKKKKTEEEAADAMSEEDKELKERLETCVSTVINAANEAAVTVPIKTNALDVIVNEIRTATASMTSVPKPLKFLRPHFATLKTLYTGMQEGAELDSATLELRARLADVLAVLAMTMGKPGM
jgi:26S proteasome regulatory subunit N1